LASSFGMIAKMWLAFFLGLLQMILDPTSNVRPCGIGLLHDVALMALGVLEEFVTPQSYIEKIKSRVTHIE
jgi:hypothetical protein